MKIALFKSGFAGPISGADETLVAYAIELHKAGYDASVLLLFPCSPKDPYYQRLREAGVPVRCILDRAFLITALRRARALIAHVLFVFVLISNFPDQMRGVWRLVLTRLTNLYLARCCTYLTAHRFDLLHVLTPDAGTHLMIRAAHLTQTATLYQELGTPHHLPGLETYYRRLAAVTPLCASVAALSPTLASEWTGVLPHAKPIGVLPLIVKQAAALDIPRRPLPFDVVFGFAARMEEGKGVFVLAEAFAEVRGEKVRALLRFAGVGAQFFDVRRRCVSAGVLDDCDFVGSYNGIIGRAAFMSSLDVFVLPSYAEGTPNSIIEAMAAGLPIIATTVGGIPDIVTNETGILVAPNDARALAAAMLRLAGDTALRGEMGQAARKRYEELFASAAVLPMLVTAYERSLGRSESVCTIHPWEKARQQ